MTDPAARSAAMIDARRVESATKRARVLAALEQMTLEGKPISVAALARRAAVSTWLLYTPPLRRAIEEARAAQRQRSQQAPRDEAPGTATDLALARVEIARLRAERDTQRRQLQLALGARLDDIAKADLVARVDELTDCNTGLAAQLKESRSLTAALEARVVDLEDELTATRTSLRRMIRAENLPAPATATNAVTTPRGG